MLFKYLLTECCSFFLEGNLENNFLPLGTLTGQSLKKPFSSQEDAAVRATSEMTPSTYLYELTPVATYL